MPQPRPGSSVRMPLLPGMSDHYSDTSLTLPTPLSTLLAVPIPSEYAARGAEVQMAVEQAVLESVEQGINMRGKEVTPWLLKRVGELTRGTALELSEAYQRAGLWECTEVGCLRRQADREQCACRGTSCGRGGQARARATRSACIVFHTLSLDHPATVLITACIVI